MFGGSGISLADIAAVTKNNDGDGAFGGNNGWWVLIILFALFGGWGNNGNGNRANGGETVVVPVPGYGMGGGYSASFTDAALQRGFDQQTLISKIDQQTYGLSSLGYDQLAQINGVNQNIMQTGFGLQNAINGVAVGAMQNANALSTQLANCCCENRQGQAQIEFSLSQLGCSLQNTMNQNTRDVLEAQCTNFRNLGDQIDRGFARLEMNQKDAEIAALRQQVNDCNAQRLADCAVDRAVAQIRPTAVPAYPASNPCGMGNWAPQVLSGYGNSCGCGQNWNGCCCG